MGTYHSLQGNMGLGKAIQFFTSHGVTVSIPLNDTQGYDLIVDINGNLNRVQVKTGRFSKGNDGKFLIGLKTAGGNSYYSNKDSKYTIKKFDNTKSDLLFIYTADEKMYLIPTNEISVSSAITVGIEETKKYEVHCKKLSELE
jgi:hypothetical protein